MEPSKTPRRLNLYLWMICPLVFLYFSVHLWLAAQGKEFWLDETSTNYYLMKRSLWLLISEGADGGQPSRTPFTYLIDRLWLYAWSDTPQRYWDLRFFFRVFPVAAWTAANTYLFAHLSKFFAEEKKLSLGLSFLFSFAIAQFSYTNNFGSYYAIESRPYSTWAGFSILHFLAVWQIIRTPSKGWKLFFFSSVLMVLTTYASLVQVFLAGGYLTLLHCFEKKRVVLFDSYQRKILFTVAAGLGAGLFYFTSRETMNFTSAPISLFLNAVMEVLLKAFHHHSHHAAFLTIPLLFVAIPLYWRKRDYAISATNLHAILIALSVFPLYWVATKKGAFFASRYAIYLIPAFTYLYVIGIVTLLILTATWLGKRFQKNLLLPALVLVAVLETVSRPIGIYKGFSQDVQRFRERNTFGYRNQHPDCLAQLPHNPWDLELVSNNCRGFSAELPGKPGEPRKPNPATTR